MNKGVYFCGTLVWFITVIHPLADVSFNLSTLLVINTMWEIMLALAGMQPQVHHHLILPVYVVFQSLPVLWRKQVGKGFWGNFPYSSLTHNCLALFQVHSQKHVGLTPFSSPSEGPDIQQNIPAKLEDDFQYSAELGLSQILTWDLWCAEHFLKNVRVRSPSLAASSPPLERYTPKTSPPIPLPLCSAWPPSQPSTRAVTSQRQQQVYKWVQLTGGLAHITGKHSDKGVFSPTFPGVGLAQLGSRVQSLGPVLYFIFWSGEEKDRTECLVPQVWVKGKKQYTCAILAPHVKDP